MVINTMRLNKIDENKLEQIKPIPLLKILTTNLAKKPMPSRLTIEALKAKLWAVKLTHSSH